MARKKRLTKKMLEIFDKAEIRRIAVHSMNLPNESAYMMDFKQITTWLYDHIDVFAQVDLDTDVLQAGSFFRDGIFEYTVALQKFVREEGEAPVWPPVSTNDEVAEESTPELRLVEEEEEEAQAEEPPAEDDGFIYATDPEAVEEEAEVSDPTPPEPPPKKLRRKDKTKVAKVVEKAEPAGQVDLTPVVNLLSETMSGLDQKISVLDANLRAGLDHRLKGIEKALLTIINLLIEEEDELSSMEDIPDL